MSSPAEIALPLQKIFLARRLTLSLAESCTGGLLAGAFTENAGSSGFFLGSAVVYSNEAKQRLLAVPALLLDKFGAVSEECARAMAAGSRRVYDSDLALSITGIAGPSGGSAEKSVGTVCFAVAVRNCEEIVSTTCLFPGNRAQVRAASVAKALELLGKAVADA